MSSKCEHCGKQGMEWDFAWGPGPTCRHPRIDDPAVGGWICQYKPPKEGVKLVAERVEFFRCPVCREPHTPDAFKDGSLLCKGCGNTITLEG